MAIKPHSLVDFSAFVDGVGLAGKVTEGAAPKVALLVEEHLAGGMGGTVDIMMGAVEKMETTVSMSGVEADYYSRIGSEISMTYRGATNDGESTRAVIHQMRGLVREADGDALKRKDKGMVKNTMTVEYYKLTINDKVILEIDVMGKSFIVDGKDLWAEQRAALGG